MRSKRKKQYKNTMCYAAVLMGMSLALSGCNMVPQIETLPVITEGESEESSTPEAEVSSAEESTLPEETAEITSEPVEVTTEDTTPSYEIADGYTAVVQIVEVTQNLNVRTGAGTEYESLGLVLGGTRLQKVSDGGEWSQVLYNGGVYYVASAYLKLVADGEWMDETSPVPSSEQEAPSSETTTHAPFNGDLNALSNETVPYGYGTNNRDEYNRPGGVLYYENLYGKYAVDFIAPNTNTIYLTMDEGYEAGYTPEILDTLKAKNVKAVFFLTKQFVVEHPELVQRMIDEGHVLGNHSCAHPAAGMPTLGIEGQTEDILWLHNYVKDNFGYEMKLFRYPSGIFSEQSLALIDSLGYHAVFWSYAHKDWNVNEQPDEPTALQNCLNQLHPGAIYLLHAVSSTNTHNMAAFIDGARAAGYEFGVYPENGF